MSALKTQSSVDWETFLLLPSLLDTLQSIRASEDQDGIQVCKNVSFFISRLERCTGIIQKLPTTDYTPEEKEEMFNRLQMKLKEKCDLVAKYQGLVNLDCEMPPDTPML